MPLNLPALPNFQTNIPQSDPLATYGKLLQLKALQGQQALLPLQVQSEQQKIQSQQQTIQGQQLANQKAQMDLDSQKAIQQAVVRGDLNKFAGVDTPDGTGFDGAGAYRALLNNPQILPEQAGAVVQSFQKIGQTHAETVKTLGQAGEAQATIRGKGFEALHDRVASTLEDPKQAAQFQYDLEHNPQIFSGVPQSDLAHVHDALMSGDMNKLKVVAGGLDVEKKLAEFHQKQAEGAKAELAVEPPSDAQLQTFIGKTIPSFASLHPEQKSAFIAEAKTARTVDELNKVVERADATDKAEQMHKDSLAQTMALKGVQFAQKGLEANDKTWTDPQHGYLQTLSQANLGKAAIKAGADGNGLLTSLEPTMAVLGMNSFAGVHRISPAEASAAGAPGGWAERFTAWADKAASGKLSPQLAKEGSALFDQLIDSKYQSSVQSSEMHAKGYNIPRENMPAMDKSGNVTTLDKAPKAGGTTPAAPGTGKSLSMDAIQRAAKEHGVSVDEAKRQAQAAGYSIQ